MITDDKIIFHYDSIKQKMPVTADIFLTNYCNNKCRYCSYKRWNLKRNNKSVTLEEFQKNAKILIEAGVKGFILTGGGEPCLCEDFDKITRWLEEQHIQYGINTNFNILKYISPVFLKVSLDCYDENSYMELRGVNNYKKVFSNIEKYIEWKQKNKVETKIILQCVADTPDKVRKFYSSVEKLDVQGIVFRPVESTLGSYYKKPELLKTVDSVMECINELKAQDGRIILNYKFNYLDLCFKTCNANFLQIAVNEYSEVIYCCHKPYEIVGRLDEEGIFQKRFNYITDMSLCDVPCRLTGPNSYLEKLQEPCDVNFI